MDQGTYSAYLRRAANADSVRELRQIADELRAGYPDDHDAERIRDVCQMYAVDHLAHRPSELRASRA